MQDRRFVQDSVIRFIEEFECKKRMHGETSRMNGAELLKMFKTNDFEYILKRIKENEETQHKFNEIESKILTILNFKDFFEILLSGIIDIFEIPYAWFTIIEKSSLADLIKRFNDSEVIAEKTRFLKQAEFDRFVKNCEKPLLVNRYLTPFTTFFPGERQYPLRSMAIVPLYLDGNLVGSLNLGDYASTRFEPDMDTSLLEQLMRKISLCLSNVAAHEKLSFYAYHDPLTGLLNRRSLESALHKEFSRSRRHDQEMTLIFVDLDNFKKINDSHGHECGDAALKYFAATLENLSRKEDIVARFAGDEFVMILPETTMDVSESLVNRLYEYMGENALHHEGVKLNISFSFGIASTSEKTISGPDELLRAADERLYAVKHGKTSELPVSIHPRILQARAS